MITQLLLLSSELEAEGRDMAALSCSQTAAKLMLLPLDTHQDEIGRSSRAAHAQIERDFDNIIRIAFGDRHPSGKVPDGYRPGYGGTQ